MPLSCSVPPLGTDARGQGPRTEERAARLPWSIAATRTTHTLTIGERTYLAQGVNADRCKAAERSGKHVGEVRFTGVGNQSIRTPLPVVLGLVERVADSRDEGNLLRSTHPLWQKSPEISRLARLTGR